ncbi:MAG TPA: hypothetical protein VKQ30_25610 [Ktedonobacterales bacterium]|nr:hypothetical protein [Ktedonobacterales bacterium]
MDEYDQNDLGAAATDEDDAYEALNDPRRVMMEVVELVADLHRATTRLGDAIVAAGLPARAWRDADSRLLLLADQFPDITVDALITRLAEFAADTGPHWLHGDREAIAQFNDEASVLYGVVRPLRMVAQRLRMIPVRERGDLPLERTLGDARVGTPLDRVAALLRDLESLGSFIVPLSAEEWNPLVPEPHQSSPVSNVAAVTANSINGGVIPTPPLAPGASLPVATPPAMQTSSTSQPFRRLRDFMPPPEERHAAPRISERDWSWLRADASVGAHALLAWAKPRKWLVVGIAIMLLAMGTALLTLARQSLSSTPSTPISYLTVAPEQITLACSGKNDTIKLTLRDTGPQTITWSIKTPLGLSLSATHGTLKAGATASIYVKVTNAKPAHGTLTFTANDGATSVAYEVSCN